MMLAIEVEEVDDLADVDRKALPQILIGELDARKGKLNAVLPSPFWRFL